MQCFGAFFSFKVREPAFDVSRDEYHSFFLSDLVVLVEDLRSLDLVRL